MSFDILSTRSIIFAKSLALKFFLVIVISFVLVSCTTKTDVFEKNVSIPKHEWSSGFKPEISFDIVDTASRYDIYVVLRHTDAYRYKNIWLNAYLQFPGDTLKKQQLNLQLATDEKGWLGSGMDDIFEHRIPITQAPVQLRAGLHRFRIEHIMREEPLENVMNIGIRVEKKP